MHKRIVIVDGHPDADDDRYVHALAATYREGALEAGHEVRMHALATLNFPLLSSNADYLRGKPPAAIRRAQQDLAWCDHLVILYPLWLGSMPALLKGFFEQVMRPGFAYKQAAKHGLPRKLLAGKTARIVVTMGMPGFFYRWYFGAHSVKSLERNILAFVGFRPIRTSLVGSVESLEETRRTEWLARMRRFGKAAS